MKAHWQLLTITALLGAVACGGEDEDSGSEEDADVGPASGAVCPTNSAVTYETDIKPFMASYCTTCHAANVPVAQRNGAPKGHNFETEQGVLDEAAHIDQEAASGPNATNTMMPPTGFPAPSVEERQKLGEYLACHGDLSGHHDDD